jgi:hypothetical protein
MGLPERDGIGRLTAQGFADQFRASNNSPAWLDGLAVISANIAADAAGLFPERSRR